jgi:hypothetical protein
MDWTDAYCRALVYGATSMPLLEGGPEPIAFTASASPGLAQDSATRRTSSSLIQSGPSVWTRRQKTLAARAHVAADHSRAKSVPLRARDWAGWDCSRRASPSR